MHQSPASPEHPATRLPAKHEKASERRLGWRAGVYAPLNGSLKACPLAKLARQTGSPTLVFDKGKNGHMPCSLFTSKSECVMSYAMELHSKIGERETGDE